MRRVPRATRRSTPAWTRRSGASTSRGASGSETNAECGMRNAELPWEVERQDTHPYTPHSTFRILHYSSGMIALARKYRPKHFSDLIVQDHVGAARRGEDHGGAHPRDGAELRAPRRRR